MATEQDVIIEIGSSNFVCPFAFVHEMSSAALGHASILSPLSTQTFPAANINIGTGEITMPAAHGLETADQVQIGSSTGVLPILQDWTGAFLSNLVGTPFPRNFYVIKTAADKFKLALTAADAQAGAASLKFFNAGTGTHTLYKPPTSSQRPYQSSHAGVRVLTARRPFSTNVARTILTVPLTTTLTYGPATADPFGHSWVYIRSNSTGQGNLRKVAGHAFPTLTVTPAWDPALAADGEVRFLQDSHTVDTIDATRKVITRVTGAVGGAGDAPNFGSEVDGKQVTFFHDHSVRLVTAHGNDTLTLDRALSAPAWNATPTYRSGQIVLHNGVMYRCDVATTTNEPPHADWSTTLLIGFCVLTGANAIQTFTGLQSSSNYSLKDMTWFMDMHAPVHLLGDDYQNFDSTTYTCPRLAYANGELGGPLMNLVPELTFDVRSRLQSDLVVIHLGAGGSRISPLGGAASPTPIDTLFVGPQQPGGDFSWFYGLSGNTWNPAQTNDLFTAIKQMFTACTALLAAEGKVPKVRLISCNLTDNDLSDEHRTELLGQNLTTIIDALRAFIGDPSIPVVIAGPSGYGSVVGWTTEDVRPGVYETLDAIAASKENVGVLDTRGFSLALDGGHYDADGEIQLAQGIFSVWDPIYTQHYEDVNAANSMAVEISNLALSLLGQSAKVFSLDTAVDQSAEARLCAQFYPPAFQAVREMHAWAFSTYTKVLKAVDKDEHRTDWAFAYLPPPDMDTPIKVQSPGMAVTSGEIPPWWRLPNAESAMASADDPNYAIEVDSLGKRVIYTNVQDALLRYVAKINSKTVVPRSFKTAVARRLAAFLAGPIVKGAAGAALTREFEGLARIELGDAAAHDANRQQKDPPPDRMPWSR